MRTHSLHPVLELVLAATVLAPRAAWAEALPPQPKDKAIIFYTGKLTDDTWVKSLTPSADMVDSRLAAVAWSEIFLRPASRAWSLEWEANAVKHWGIQDHWEFNLAVTKMTSDDNGTYAIQGSPTSTDIVFRGISTLNASYTADCTVDSTGKTSISYSSGW